MLDPDRPIYPSAPLKLVTFQVRFPPVPELDSVSPPQMVAEALKPRYPILGGPPPVLQVELGPGQSSIGRPRGARLMNRERTRSVTLIGDSVSIETSKYERYEVFADEVDWVLERVNEHTPFPAVTRLGLRYIDEIQVDGVLSVEDWKPWINNDLLIGGLVDGYQTDEYLTHIVFTVDDDRRMTVRYGRVSQQAVDPNGALRIDRAPAPDSPYFLIDIDSYWEPSRDSFREFVASEVRDVCLQLHDPIREIFERATKPELRAEFAKERGDGE